MCSWEGKQIQLLLENSSRQCQKPTSCTFANNIHVPCFPRVGAYWGDFRHCGMSGDTVEWEETFEYSEAELFLQLLFSASPHTQLNLSVSALEHRLCGAISSQRGSDGADLPCLSCHMELMQVPARNLLERLWETILERHCPVSRLDYLGNISLAGRKVHLFHQLSAIRICQLWEICSVNKWLGHQELDKEKPEVIVPKHLLFSL